MSFAVSLGTFAGDFTQHSLNFLHFVALMSPLRHHPLILLPQQSSLVFLLRVFYAVEACIVLFFKKMMNFKKTIYIYSK